MQKSYLRVVGQQGLQMQKLVLLVLALAVVIMMFACGKSEKAADKIPDVPTENTYSEGVRLKALNDAIAANPTDPENFHRRALLHLESGTLKAAYDDALRATALDSNQAKYYLTLAKIFVKLPNMMEAGAAIDKARQKGLDTPDLHCTHGQILYIQRKYGLAIEALNKALKVAENYAPAYLYKGLIYAETGDTAKAMSNLQTAIEQSPDQVDAYTKLSSMYLMQGNDKLAFEYLKSGLRFAPRDPFLYLGMGDYYERRNEPDSAREYFRRASFMNPELYVPYLRLGALAARKKDWKPAIANLKQAVEHSTHDPLPSLYLAKALEADDQLKDALYNYQQVVVMNAGFVPDAEAGIARLAPKVRAMMVKDSLKSVEERGKVLTTQQPDGGAAPKKK